MSDDLGHTPPDNLLRPGPGDRPAGAAANQAPTVTNLSMADLLRKYPQGFVVSRSGILFEVVGASGSLPTIAAAHGLPPEGGGYFVTRPTGDRIRQP